MYNGFLIPPLPASPPNLLAAAIKMPFISPLMNSCPPLTILLEELRGAQAACFELFFKTPGLEICPPVYEVKIFLGHCRCRQGIVCVRPKDSKNPSKLEWDGGATMVLVERIGSIVNCGGGEQI